MPWALPWSKKQVRPADPTDNSRRSLPNHSGNEGPAPPVKKAQCSTSPGKENKHVAAAPAVQRNGLVHASFVEDQPPDGDSHRQSQPLQQHAAATEEMAGSESTQWEEYDGHIDELLSSATGSRAAAQRTTARQAAKPPVAACRSEAAEAAPGLDGAAQPAHVVLLCDSSVGSDWNDDDIMMTLSDGAREHDGDATVSSSLTALLRSPAVIPLERASVFLLSMSSGC